MFAQLGEIVFKGLNGFSSLSFAGAEASYGEIDLVNNKPIIQHTGFTLSEISIEVMLDVAFCNPTQQITSLQSYKDNTAVLPFLFGNGRFIGHYVVTGCPFEVIHSFEDGTFKQINVSLSLKEYYTVDPLEQKKLAASAKAFAINTTPNINVPQIAEVNVNRLVAADVTSTKASAELINKDVLELNPNSSQITVDNIRNNANKARMSLTRMIDRIDGNIKDFENHPNIKTAAVALLGNINEMITAYPFSDIIGTNTTNRDVQANTRLLSAASTNMFKQIIIRR